MKKVLILLCLLFTLFGCSNPLKSNKDDPGKRYLDMAALARSYEEPKKSVDMFDLRGEIAKTDEGYRYYVFIDNPRSALYNIKAIAVEDNSDYTKNMAANIGIFETKRYNMIPNQSKVEDGYVSGISISGISSNSQINLRVLVQWENKDASVINRDCYILELEYGK